MNSITKYFKSKLFAGIATLLPLYLTFFVIKFLFNTLEEISGPLLKKLHIDIGSYAKNSKIDILITFGELSKFASSGFQKKSYNFYNEEQLKAFIADFIKKNDIVLIKGSRGMKMERFI